MYIEYCYNTLHNSLHAFTNKIQHVYLHSGKTPLRTTADKIVVHG